MGTKNNPKNRAKAAEKKKHNSKEVDPVLYHGTNAGHGKYISAKYSGTTDLVVDGNGRPIPWDNI
ncbi:MAG: hypothetical protein O3B09_04035 [Proteobacteria bacterium]|nr:hypothetical protein [Pseudomonadota bacterium]